MSENTEKPRINPWSIWLIVAVIAGGFVVYSSWVKTVNRQAQDQRPMLGARLETDLKLVDQFGKEVTLGDLKGKVYLANYVFTRCPGQCGGVSGIMQERLGDYNGHPLFRMASISLDPEHDRPEDMLDFSKRLGLESKQWWFLTGDESEINAYMRRYFKFTKRLKEPEERMSEFDLYDHDPLIALIDHGGHIRGIYNVLDPDRGKEYQDRLKSDLDKVMVEAMEAIPQASLPEEDLRTRRSIDADIALQRHDGEAVKFSDLRGKVTLVSHVFTRCPYQCPGICAALNEIRKDFASHPAGGEFMVASMTMDPAHDTPEVLTTFAEGHQLLAENWWFLTGEERGLRDFMQNQLLFGQQEKPEADRNVPNDIYEHDFNVVLMDHEMNLLDWYDFSKEGEIEKLRADLKQALDAIVPAGEGV